MTLTYVLNLNTLLYICRTVLNVCGGWLGLRPMLVFSLDQAEHKQVRGTTRCVNSDRGGQNCKICLNLLFYFITSQHLTKPRTIGTICHHLVPFVTIWYHLVPFGTICYHLLPFITIGYHSVPLYSIWYHFGWQGTMGYH